MITFIDDHRTRWGVEPIRRVLPIAPSTYYAAKKRSPAQRTLRDEYLKVHIERAWKENFKVYGADKIWVALNREKIKVARCSVERLMRHMGIRGARRGRKVFTTTTADDFTARPADLVQRQFSAPAPNIYRSATPNASPRPAASRASAAAATRSTMHSRSR